ncbi:MAG TPA: adenylate/guanylate cyclase domain-containing protein, partial [Mycobacterium sp.]|nr:adenylate/guanylate cyclase domain-containing protein [Mycobacterium sp.]
MGVPSGTVTFLFTDIEGSTRLWEASPDAMRSALVRHDSIVRSTIAEHGGYVFATGGDGFAAAFARAGDALQAALDAQVVLTLETWPEPALVRVRMALHTGEVDERGGDYFGPAVNRAARLMAAGHGGQVLVSGVTAGLVADQLPHGVTLVDLGEHRLKDLDIPEHVFQAIDKNLDRQFPPLRTLDAVPNNLPRQLTRFIGRQREVHELTALVPGNQVVTLTGAAGIGKTRLALQVAAEVLDHYRDGVWFVDLARISDPAQVPKQIAVAMGVQEQVDRPIASTLLDRLQGRETLVLLDNCEHVIDGAATCVERLLGSTTAVSVLATSREALGIPGETVWIVPPMALPEADQERLADNEAIGLFVDRGHLVNRAFRLTDGNGSACADICRGVDGMPLAIELAAARLSVLSPRQIADRLGEGLALLSKGARTAVARQHTLRAAIDWSYDLLSSDEQALLRRLAAFRGGFTLEAAQAMWSPKDTAATSALDLLESLVDKSLVTVTPHGQDRRFGLLQTIHAYAWERLEQAGETATMLERHRAFFLQWAHRQNKLLSTPDQLQALAALEADHDNLRVVLERSVAEGDLENALLLAADLCYFWFIHSHFGQSGAWYDKLLAERGRVTPRARIKLLLGAGEFSVNTGDLAGAAHRFQEARRLAQQAESPRMEGWALYNLLVSTTFEMKFDEASQLAAEALQRFEAAGDQYGVGLVTFNQAGLEMVTKGNRLGSMPAEDAQQLLVRLEPMLEIARALGERNSLGHALEQVGTAAIMAHRYSDAAEFMADAVDAFDTLGNQGCLAHCLDRVAWL